MDKLEGLYPPFAEKVKAFLQNVRSRKDPLAVGVFEGLRTFEKQAEYYKQGRETPGKIITWAKPGMSWHQYGCAVDIVFDAQGDRQGFQWRWDEKYPWDTLALVGKAVYGLDAGRFWPSNKKDSPHFQIATDMTIYTALAVYQKEGLKSVWAYLDKLN